MLRGKQLCGFVFAFVGFGHLLFAADAAPATEHPAANTASGIEHSNPEMKAIFDADQADRETHPINWSIVGPADEKRRDRTRELLAQNQLQTGQDFEEAAFVFQHGDSSDSFLFAHILATVAIAKGNKDAIWIAAATLDRYLLKIGQKQVLGTQYRRPDSQGPWTQEPYDRALVADALRLQLKVGTEAKQAEYLKTLQSQN